MYVKKWEPARPYLQLRVPPGGHSQRSGGLNLASKMSKRVALVKQRADGSRAEGRERGRAMSKEGGSYNYRADGEDGPQEMERNEAAARHSWARQHAWPLLRFFPFLVRHPPCRRQALCVRVHCTVFLASLDSRSFSNFESNAAFRAGFKL